MDTQGKAQVALAASPFQTLEARAVNPFAAAIDPFAAAADPFAALAPYAGVADADPNAPPPPYTYAMLRSGPAVDPEEVEVAHLASIEVITRWDSNVLRVDHLTPPRSYFVGEEVSDDKTPCDMFLPSEMLGTTRAPVVVVRGGGAALVILPRSHGTVDIPGRGQVTLADLIASGQAKTSHELAGAHEFELPAGAKARMEIDGAGIVFEVSAVNAGKTLAGGMFSQLDATAYVYFALSLIVHLGTVAALAFFMPHRNVDDSEAVDRDTMLMMQHLLDASADREKEKLEEQVVEANASTEGGEGARAKDQEGKMGKENTPETGHKVATAGPADNPDPHLARMAAIKEAAEGGFVGFLNSAAAGDPSAVTSPWGRDESSGKDSASFNGNMWGDAIGDSGGMGGLGLSGTGLGGGGDGTGYGLGEIAGLGHGAGHGPGDGFGNGHDHLGGHHATHAPRMTEGVTEVNGHLPGEVIQRIVRQNFGRFRLCYNEGLRINPNLSGRVSVKFAIDRTGSVAMSMDGGSDIPDRNVISCVVRGFQNLSFPQPQGGIVTVTYPIIFTPSGE